MKPAASESLSTVLQKAPWSDRLSQVALGVPPARIVLAGESQGGALALLAALSCLRHKV